MDIFVDKFIKKIIDVAVKSVIDININNVNKKKKIKYKKICFITSLYGKNLENVDKPGIFKIDENYDYFLFTNFKPKHFNTSWTIIKTDFKNEEFFFRNNVIKSRYPKFMAWKFLKNYSNCNYNTIIYCDAFLSPDFNFNWELIFTELNDNKLNDNKLNDNKLNFIQSLHHYDLVRNGGIYEDCKLIITAQKDTFENISRTLSFFKKNGLGGINLKKKNYVVNTVFAYNINCPKTTSFLQDFWDLYQCPGFTIRDQPLWNYLLLKKKLKTIIFENVILGNSKNKNKNKKFTSMKDDIFIETGDYTGHNIFSYS